MLIPRTRNEYADRFYDRCWVVLDALRILQGPLHGIHIERKLERICKGHDQYHSGIHMKTYDLSSMSHC